MITEKEITDKYLGIPYRARGRTMENVDCYGIIMLIYLDLGIQLYDIPDDYSVGWAKQGHNFFAENYYREWIKIEKPNMFDVVAFKNADGVTNHAGVCLGDTRFIQSARRHGVIVSRWSDEPWLSSLEGFYRFKGRNDKS